MLPNQADQAAARFDRSNRARPKNLGLGVNNENIVSTIQFPIRLSDSLSGDLAAIPQGCSGKCQAGRDGR